MRCKLKKVIVVLVFALSVSIMAQSPIGKGSLSLGGSVSFTSQSYDNSSGSQSTLMINPKAGYFFIDNFYTALSLSYVHLNFDGWNSDVYGFGPAVRYYFDAGKIKPFMGLGYNYIEQNHVSDSGNHITNEFIISAGLDFFIIDALALESSINYSFTSYKISDSRMKPVKSKVFRIDIGLNYFIY